MSIRDKWQDVVRRREDIVRKAVQAADRVILDESEGSSQEIAYITAQVACEFVNKVCYGLKTQLGEQDLKRIHP